MADKSLTNTIERMEGNESLARSSALHAEAEGLHSQAVYLRSHGEEGKADLLDAQGNAAEAASAVGTSSVAPTLLSGPMSSV